jgi:hypothetical protein
VLFVATGATVAELIVTAAVVTLLVQPVERLVAVTVNAWEIGLPVLFTIEVVAEDVFKPAPGAQDHV